MSNDLKKLQEKLQELTKDSKNLNIAKIQRVLNRIEKIKAYNKAYTKKYYENVRKNKLAEERKNNKAEIKVKCAICGKEFIARSVLGKYCSDECRHKATIERNKKYTDKEKVAEYQAKYRQTEGYKKSQSKYRKSAKGKATFKKYYEKYKANGYKGFHTGENIQIN